MDEKLKYKLYFVALIILSLLTFLGFFGYWKSHESLQSTPIIVNRSSLKEYKLLKLFQTSDGYKMNLLQLDNIQEIDNIFLSKECPEAASKNPGLKMKLDIVTYFVPGEQETYKVYDRAYDYLCTNDDMVSKDANLMKRIQEARTQSLISNLHLKN